MNIAPPPPIIDLPAPLNPKPDKLFKKCLIMLVLSGINNFLNKLISKLSPRKPSTWSDVLRKFIEAECAGIAEISCGRKPVLSTMDGKQDGEREIGVV